MKKILMVEDDVSIINLAEIHLRDNHYLLTKSHNGYDALQYISNNSYELIILDLMLPDINGIELCKKIRSDKNLTPIMILTARNDEIDKIVGLEVGADDYLTKPFSIREFVARVKALIRRSNINDQQQKSIPDILIHEHLNVEFSKRKVLLNNIPIDLTPKEFDLLYLFMNNPGRTYSRENLLNIVWGYDFSGYEHTVNSHINRLRSKIELDLANPKYILTTWGIGYRFTDEKNSSL